MSKKFSKTTILILLDSFRWDYLHPKDTPYLWSLKGKGVYAKKLYNPGGYCERSVFMTGANPEITDNYFAMALMPPGYKRAYYEPMFNVPIEIRSRLAMTEDLTPDFEKGSFKNWTTGKTIESFWDVMRENKKTFAVEACVALGIKSYKGRTTHGSRVIQLIDKLDEGHDFYYIQFSEIDQEIHYSGTSRNARKALLRNVDADIKKIVEEAEKRFNEVNLIIFGDHGMGDVKEKIDLALEYPPYILGWDYLYLKSSAAVQFWIFNQKVEERILNDPILLKHGEFIKSPTPRQGDIVWRANTGTLVSPCHFHPRNDPIKAMHGWDPKNDSQKGMAIVIDGKRKGEVEEIRLNDICAEVCNLVGVRQPKYSKGVVINV